MARAKTKTKTESPPLSIIERSRRSKKIRTLLSYLDDDELKMPRGIKRELTRMTISIKGLSRKSKKQKSKRPYDIVLPDATERDDLTVMNEYVVYCIAYRERLHQIVQELIDVKRRLSNLIDDINAAIWTKFECDLIVLKTDRMRKQIVEVIALGAYQRMNVIESAIKQCGDQGWVIKAVQDGLKLICDNTHRALPVLLTQ